MTDPGEKKKVVRHDVLQFAVIKLQGSILIINYIIDVKYNNNLSLVSQEIL